MAAALTSERWSGNWRVVSPPGSARIDVERGRAGKIAATEEARRLPAGSPVVIVAAAPGSARRARQVAARAGIRVEQEYLALPSAAAPAYLIEDDPAPFRVFVDTVLASPSSGLAGRVQDALVSIVRRVRPRGLVGSLGAGRVVVGWRA
jgi:hypothetical protein